MPAREEKDEKEIESGERKRRGGEVGTIIMKHVEALVRGKSRGGKLSA